MYLILLIAMTNTFTPNPQVPGLQYVRTVDKDGPAALAGLHDGDFLIEVGWFCLIINNDIIFIIG